MIPESGAHFVNHSYGFNLENYERDVVRNNSVIGKATDNLSHMDID